jgi:hypothetical protein
MITKDIVNLGNVFCYVYTERELILNFSIEEILYLPSGNGLTIGLRTCMESSTPALYGTTVIDISINYLFCCDHIYLLCKTMQLPTLDSQRDTKMVCPETWHDPDRGYLLCLQQELNRKDSAVPWPRSITTYATKLLRYSI